MVGDVTRFPGHIACDGNSRSEICGPVRDQAGNLIAVFDVDSTEVGSFDEVDKLYLTRVMDRHFA